MARNYYKRQIFEDLTGLFFDRYGRPKINPINESTILRRLEEKYDSKELVYALRKMQEQDLDRRLAVRIKKVEKLGRIKFYYPHVFNNRKYRKRVVRKIEKHTKLIKRYSSTENTRMLGDHLHHLVKNELRAQQFMILGEKTNILEGKKWHTHHSLDIIAQSDKNGKRVGIEIKNTLDIMPSSEVNIKLQMCRFFGLTPVFACRWIKPFHAKIHSNGGFIWEFKKQIYPLGQEKLVANIQRKFKLPVEVMPELPLDAVTGFRDWHQKANES